MRISYIRKLPICRSIYTANIVDHIRNELMLRPINVFSVRNYMCLFACRLVFHLFILVNQRKTYEEELCSNYSWQFRNSYTTVYVYIYVFFFFFSFFFSFVNLTD